MNRMSNAKRAQILGFLVEGMSLRAASRLADCSINTVTRLLVETGQACAAYQDEALRNIRSRRIECDEIWSFVGSKQKNVPENKTGEYGDIWTWTALDPDSKLMVSWMVGNRDAEAAKAFMTDLRERLAHRVQLTTDGNNLYLNSVENAFAGDVDYAILIKHYGGGSDTSESNRRYSPAPFVKAEKRRINGSPDMDLVSTSLVERTNLTLRMSARRFTRLTNAFSKKAENHSHAVALHFMWYNFGRIHRTLRVTPAMEAGIASHVWTLEEIAALVQEPEAKKRGPYKKKTRA